MIKQLTVYKNYIINRYVHRCYIEKPPVFIVGCGHSGTSVLLAILGSHPNIYAIPYESKIGYKKNKQRLTKRFNHQTIASMKLRWIEKTPKHIRCISTLIESFPGSKILLIIRDGRDVVCSFRDRFGDINIGLDNWVQENNAGKIFHQNSDVCVLKYEELISDFKITISKILNFIGEDYVESMEDFYAHPKYYYSKKIERPPDSSNLHHDQYRNWQINQPLFDGRGKWKEMSDEEKILVKEKANNLLIEFGYVDNNKW